MNITLLGATGKSGHAFLQLVDKNTNSITALVRNKDKLMNADRIKVIEGDVLNYDDVEKSIQGSDVVISLLGHVKNSPSDLQTKAMENVIRAMEKNSVKRLIDLTGAGVKVKEDKPGLIDNLMTFMVKIVAKNRFWDGVNHAALISQSLLDWTIVRVPVLTSSAPLKNYGVSYVGDPKLSFQISRIDVADFILKIINDSQYFQKSPYIANLK